MSVKPTQSSSYNPDSTSSLQSKSSQSKSSQSKPSSQKRRSPSKGISLSPRIKAIVRKARDIENILTQLACIPNSDPETQHRLIEHHDKIKHLNSFGKQLIIRMFRSNERFRGYRVDFDHHILKADVLFLVGTLCDSFDYMNTSPIFGLSVLDIGCGALATYASPDTRQDLMTQFYADRPPVAPEMLQILGARTVGLDPRKNSKADYKYDVAYKHFSVEFEAVATWLQTTQQMFDVISCIHLFNRQSFLYDYSSYEDTAAFFRNLRNALLPDGLLYSSPPLIPSSEENRCTNRRIFTKAGFQIVHEGYFLIATTRPS